MLLESRLVKKITWNVKHRCGAITLLIVLSPLSCVGILNLKGSQVFEQ